MVKIGISLLILLLCIARLSYTDIKYKELENLYILLLLPCAFCYPARFSTRLIGAAVPFVLVKFFGFGDILLLSVLGFVFGFSDLVSILAASSILSGVWSAYLLASKRASKGTKIAYAPFICIGVIFLMFIMIKR